jgi:hypothetical protein
MTKDLRSLPVKLLAVFGFLLNTLWEFAQCLVLYDMSGWSFWRAAVYMWAAIAGDVLIVLGVVMASWILSQRSLAVLLSRRGWITTLALGLVAGVLLEWFARVLDLWNYSTLMPAILVAGEAVGLAPIIQIMILPATSLYCVVLYQERRVTASRSTRS